MITYPDLYKLHSELDRCVTCGVCNAVCPTYLLSERELLSPRGRIVLLRRLLAGDIQPQDIGADTYDFCTLCYACQSACPAGVKTDLLFITARKIIAEAVGIEKAKERVFDALENPGKLETALKMGSLAQKVGGQRFIEMIVGGMAVPKLQGTPLLKRLPESVEPEGRRRMRIAYFLGCMSNYVLPGPALATLTVLQQLGAEVVIPQQQVCCGAPAFNNGDWETARRLAKRNLDALEEANPTFVLSEDATCGGAFKHEIPSLLDEDEDYGVLALKIAQKTMDFPSLVVDRLDPHFPDTKQPPLEVTLHDSCHLTHTQKAHGKLRELIERLPGVKIVEAAEAQLCCGFGGSFSAMYPEEAQQWTQRKVKHFVDAGVTTVIASSPGCAQQLVNGFQDRGYNHIKVMHPAELIVQRCGWDVQSPVQG